MKNSYGHYKSKHLKSMEVKFGKMKILNYKIPDSLLISEHFFQRSAEIHKNVYYSIVTTLKKLEIS